MTMVPLCRWRVWGGQGNCGQWAGGRGDCVCVCVVGRLMEMQISSLNSFNFDVK